MSGLKMNDGLDGLAEQMKANARGRLHLIVYAKWFKLIDSGVKTEEYRDMTPYWHKRLAGQQFSRVVVRNGYDTFAPQAAFEFAGLDIGYGNPEWGAPVGRTVFIIQLGKRIEDGKKPQKDTNAEVSANTEETK